MRRPVDNLFSCRYLLHYQPQIHGLENRREVAERQVAIGRQHLEKLCGIHLELFGNRPQAAERLRQLAQHGQQVGLIVAFQNIVEDFQRQGWLADVQLGHRVVMGSASHRSIFDF